jgi:hypothetical protein
MGCCYPFHMSQASTPTPFRDGFAALWHEPLLLAAELTWRWCFGFSAWMLGCLSLGLFLKSIQVSKADQILLGTLQPALLGPALQHMFHGTLARVLLLLALLLLGLTMLWSFASAVGRTAILRRLIAMFSRSDEPPEDAAPDLHFASIFLLHLLRAIWTQIAVAVTAVLLIYGSMLADRQRPFASAFTLSFGVGIACLIGLALNWYLGLAPLFCLRNDADAIEAIEQATTFSTRHSGRLFLMALGYFALRLVWLGTLWTALLAPLSLSGKIAAGWIGLIMALVATVYFAGVDLLHLARWAAYVSLAEDDADPKESPAPERAKPPLLPLETPMLEGLA